MSNADRAKWEGRYAAGDTPDRGYPTEVLARWLPDLPRGRALDLACGMGRNAIALARAGFDVDALDISASALARGRERAEADGLNINWVEQDLDSGALPHDDYAVVVVARFLSRAAVPWILDAMRDDGVVVYETHLLTSREVDGPKSRDFRVRPNELLHLFWPLRVLHYRERIETDLEGRLMALAELVACKGDGGL